MNKSARRIVFVCSVSSDTPLESAQMAILQGEGFDE
jgi:hypothetical protein